MSDTWGSAIPSFLVASSALILPGLAVLLSGWGWRRPFMLLFAPAVSTGLLAIAATAAPIFGLAWSVLPLALLTVIACLAAYALRRWVGEDPAARPTWGAIVAPVIGWVLAAVIIAVQLHWVFIRPDSISQTFDAIVHLNTAAYAIETSNASALHIGDTSDIGFYPNAWHSLTALAAQATGVPVPVAVNSANIAIGAVAWPASAMVLAAAALRERPAAFILSAALSTGFGAFPLLLLMFGVLYPNMMAYAVLPAGLAAVMLIGRESAAAARSRAGILLGVLAAGIGLAHPNAFLALYAFGSAVAVAEAVKALTRSRSRRTWLRSAALVGALTAGGVALWLVARTGYDMSRWGPWQSTAQAAGEALLLAPREYPVTITVVVLAAAGMIATIRHPRRHLAVGAPFVVAVILFVLASGTGVGNPIRELLTNPWYNDSYRLAALLPIAGLPVATLGGLVLLDGVRTRLGVRAPAAVLAVLAVVVTIALFASLGAGPNVLRTAADARSHYVLGDTSALLTTDERRLIERLPDTTPPGALIAGSPWTGTSLAYALADRAVLEKHVFGTLTSDERYLDAHLRDIDDDPRVCEIVERLGVDYVLDFGTQNVFNSPLSGQDRVGLTDLAPSETLVLVDSEGPSARLFRIDGC